MSKSCTEWEKSDVSYRKRANPVRNGKNRTFRTEKGSILYGKKKNWRSVQKRTQSCTERRETAVSYRKGLNPVRKEEKQPFRTEKSSILYGKKRNRCFVQKRTQSCTGQSSGLAKQCGRGIVAPPLALYPSQRLQQEALHGAFKGSICASAVANIFVTRKQVCSMPHNCRVLSTMAKINY